MECKSQAGGVGGVHFITDEEALGKRSNNKKKKNLKQLQNIRPYLVRCNELFYR